MTHGFLWSCPEEIVLVDRTGLFDSNDQISEIPIFVLAVTQSHLSDFKSSISSRAKSGETLEMFPFCFLETFDAKDRFHCNASSVRLSR